MSNEAREREAESKAALNKIDQLLEEVDVALQAGDTALAEQLLTRIQEIAAVLDEKSATRRRQE